MLHARRRLATALVVCLGLAPGCRPHAKPVQPADTGGTARPGGDTGGAVAVAPITKVTEMLPPSTMLFVDVASPARIAEIVGRDALVKEFASEYARISAELSRELGIDPLDPSQLSQIGVDGRGRFGFAILSVSPLVGVVWFSVSDKAKLRAKVFETTARTNVELVSIPMAGAEVLRPKDQSSALVLREPFAAFVFVNGQAETDQALAIAGADPLHSLASDRGFRKATGASAPADAMLYLDARSLVAAIPPRGDEPQGNWARDELMAARSRGEPAERIAQLEGDAKRVDEENARWQRRRQAERKLIDRLFGGIGQGVWTASAKPQGMVFDGRATLEPGSLPLQLVRNRSGDPALPRALATRPLWLMTGLFDPSELVAFTDLAAQADGGSWTELVAEVARETGIDLDKDVRPIVTGDAGFALTLDRPMAADEAQPARALGVAIDIELADPAKAGEVLARAAKQVAAKAKAQGKSADVAIKPEGKGWLVDVKDWRKVHVGVWGNHFVVSTDADLGKRLVAGTPGKAKIHDGALAAVSQPGAAFSALLDLELSLWLFMGRSFATMPVAVEAPGAPKKSKAVIKAERELARIDAAIQTRQRKREAARSEGARAVVEPWGSIAGNIRTEAEGLAGQGGWFVRDPGGIAGALRSALVAARKLGEIEADPEMDKLFDQRNAAQTKLDAAREAQQVKVTP